MQLTLQTANVISDAKNCFYPIIAIVSHGKTEDYEVLRFKYRYSLAELDTNGLESLVLSLAAKSKSWERVLQGSTPALLIDPESKFSVHINGNIL